QLAPLSSRRDGRKARHGGGGHRGTPSAPRHESSSALDARGPASRGEGGPGRAWEVASARHGRQKRPSSGVRRLARDTGRIRPPATKEARRLARDAGRRGGEGAGDARRRHTMGSNQKKQVKGDVSGVVVTPVTAPKAETPAANVPTPTSQ